METIKKFKISLKPLGGKTVDIDKLCIALTSSLSEKDIKSLIDVFKKGGYKLNMAVKYRSKDFLKMFNENSSHARIYMAGLAMLEDENGRKIFKLSISAGLTMISWTGLDVNSAIAVAVEEEEVVDETNKKDDKPADDKPADDKPADDKPADEVVEEKKEVVADEVVEEKKEVVADDKPADEEKKEEKKSAPKKTTTKKSGTKKK